MAWDEIGEICILFGVLATVGHRIIMTEDASNHPVKFPIY